MKEVSRILSFKQLSPLLTIWCAWIGEQSERYLKVNDSEDVTWTPERLGQICNTAVICLSGGSSRKFRILAIWTLIWDIRGLMQFLRVLDKKWIGPWSADYVYPRVNMLWICAIDYGTRMNWHIRSCWKAKVDSYDHNHRAEDRVFKLGDKVMLHC